MRDPHINLVGEPSPRPFINEGARPIAISAFDPRLDRERIQRLRAAMPWIRRLILEADPQCAACRDAFCALPLRRSLEAVWTDPAVSISYTPSARVRGYTDIGTKLIVMTFDGLMRSPREIAATLLHELAHLNGAPAGATLMAESLLPRCGFADLYDPTAQG